MSRRVTSKGHIFTFEFNQDRVEKAIQDFEFLGLHNVSVAHRDVCRDGVPPPAHPTATHYDAIFLDLPSPWSVIPSVAATLKPSGVVCLYSPCIEQVQKSYAALVEQGVFSGLTTCEVLIKRHNVKATYPGIGVGATKTFQTTEGSAAVAYSEMKGHTAFLTFATRTPDFSTTEDKPTGDNETEQIQLGDDQTMAEAQEEQQLTKVDGQED
eukprot:c13905_g1_i2.p1 GENE.c13905_g1_i2~~c13905_g1_i2.p1  ORF type:complete len:211 (-),score=53.10 c13905_g1_i2:199-831(-)